MGVRRRPGRRRVARWVVAVALLASGFGACGGGDDDSTTSTPTSSGSAPSSVGAGEPQVGGVLRLGIERLATFDPLDAAPESVSAAIAADLLYDGLTAAGERATVPALASSWAPVPGANGWRFTLRGDAVFANGQAVTAASVVASLQRAVTRGLAGLEDVTEVRAVDDSTVEVVLARPVSSLPEVLAAPQFGVVGLTVGGGLDPAIGGTGPLRLAGVVGDVVRLVRATDGSTYVDGIELHQFVDAAAAYAAFEAGVVDWSLVPAASAEAAAETFGTDGFVPFQATLSLAFNLADPAFTDVRFRRAIAAAIDREAIVGAVYFGVASPLSSIVPAGVPGGGAVPDGHDPERAMALLAELAAAGLAVPEVVLDHEDTPAEAVLAHVVEEQLEAVGLVVALRPHAPADFADFVVSGSQAFARFGFVGTSPTPEAYLARQFRTGAPDDVTGFSDLEVDVLLEGAAQATDTSARLALLARAEEAIVAATPIVPIAQFATLSASSPAVHDLSLTVSGTFDANVGLAHDLTR